MPQNNSNNLIGQQVMITIKRMGINGEGIGFYKKKITFIPGAITGEVVIAEITEANPKFLRATLIRVKEKSPNRIPLPNSHLATVGGLELAHLTYDEQLKFKRDVVVQSLEKFKPRNYENYHIDATIPAENIWGYRAKASYQIGFENGKVISGLYEPNSHNLVDLPTMPTQSKDTQRVERLVTSLIEKYSISVANEMKHFDGIRTVIVRQSDSTSQIQVTLISTRKDVRHLDLLVKELSQDDQVVSIYQNINGFKTSEIWGNETIKLWGKDTIEEDLFDRKFNLSPRAFFQLNPVQTVKLYQTAYDSLNLSKDSTLLDAYSGIGTIGIGLANQVKEVYGIDEIKEGINDAKQNAKQNDIENVHYTVGKVEEILPRWNKKGLKFDAVIVDPPRKGLDERVIQAILKTEPEQFTYISCNPSTLARDLRLISTKYDVEYIKPIDMFPNTAKVEAVVKLVRSH